MFNFSVSEPRCDLFVHASVMVVRCRRKEKPWKFRLLQFVSNDLTFYLAQIGCAKNVLISELSWLTLVAEAKSTICTSLLTLHVRFAYTFCTPHIFVWSNYFNYTHVLINKHVHEWLSFLCTKCRIPSAFFMVIM